MALHTILNIGLRQYTHTFKGTNYVESSQCIYIWLNFMESSLEVMNKVGSTTKAVNETAWRVPGKHRETLHNSSQQQRKKLCSVSIYIHIHTYTKEGLWKSSSDLSREGMVNHSTPHSSSPQSQPILT